MNDVMIASEHKTHVSGNCDGAAAMIVVNDEKRTLPLEVQKRAVKISASVLTSDPYVDGCQILPDVNTLTRNVHPKLMSKPVSGPRI